MKTILLLFALSLVCRAETLMDRDNKPWSNGSRDWESYAMSAKLRQEAGHPTCRIGAGRPFACSWKRWITRVRTGVWNSGHGWSRVMPEGEASMEWACYLDHGHLIQCARGFNTPDSIKRGGWNGRVSYW